MQIRSKYMGRGRDSKSSQDTICIEPCFKDLNAAKRFTCAICIGVIKDAVTIGCGEHIFCDQCIRKLISSKGTRFPCPSCRKQCSSKSVNRVGFIDKQINDLIVICPNHEITKEKEKYIERKRISEAEQNMNHNSNNNVRRSERLRKVEMKETEDENIDLETSSNSNNKTKLSGHKRKREDDDNDHEMEDNNNRKRIKLNHNSNNMELDGIDDDLQETLDDLGLCQWTGSYSEFQQHINLCPFQLRTCEYCDKSMLSRDLAHHYDLCGSYPMRCDQCLMINIKRDAMSHHILNECPKTEIQCSLGCGQSMKREKERHHIRIDCVERKITCRYPGCAASFKRKAEDVHNQEHVADHLKMVERTTRHGLFQLNRSLISRVVELENQIIAFNETQQRLIERISDLEKQSKNQRK